MPSKKISILVVDDDARMLRMVQQILELEKYRVLTATSGEFALAIFDEETPALVLLDIMMPGMDGFTVCRRIREFSQVPIIMVSAKHNDTEKVEGLDAGADDYVTKPFSAPELAARVRAALRRTATQNDVAGPSFRSADLVIDYTRRRVNVGKTEMNLTAVEYKLLSYLAQNSGRVVTPDQIMEAVWGEEYIGENHVLHVNISRLRQKLGDTGNTPKYILTRPGIGYMMVS